MSLRAKSEFLGKQHAYQQRGADFLPCGEGPVQVLGLSFHTGLLKEVARLLQDQLELYQLAVRAGQALSVAVNLQKLGLKLLKLGLRSAMVSGATNSANLVVIPTHLELVQLVAPFERRGPNRNLQLGLIRLQHATGSADSARSSVLCGS